MYKVSQEVKNLFNKNYIQVADITVNGVNESFSVAENEIVQGSLSIDRYSVSNSKGGFCGSCGTHTQIEK